MEKDKEKGLKMFCLPCCVAWLMQHRLFNGDIKLVVVVLKSKYKVVRLRLLLLSFTYKFKVLLISDNVKDEFEQDDNVVFEPWFRL